MAAPTLTVGVDLGGTKIQTAILRASEVAGTARTSTPQTGPDDVVAAIVQTIAEAAAAAHVKVGSLHRVGVGSPGTVDSATGLVSHASNINGFEAGFALGPKLAAATGAAVVVDNDVRVAILGEHRLGAGRGIENLVGVFLGTGVGGGLVLNGTIRRGRGAAGEIGHTVVKDGGRLCSCGRKGCLEAYASRGGIERQARALHKKGRKTELFDIMRSRGRDHFTSGVIARALERKDKLTIELIDEAVWALGIGLASAQNLLDLEAIIIGGGLGDRLGQPFIDRVAAAMKPHLFVDDKPPAMFPTKLQDLSGAVGAALRADGD